MNIPLRIFKNYFECECVMDGRDIFMTQCMCRDDGTTSELIFSFHLYSGSRNWTQVTRPYTRPFTHFLSHFVGFLLYVSFAKIFIFSQAQHFVFRLPYCQSLEILNVVPFHKGQYNDSFLCTGCSQTLSIIKTWDQYKNMACLHFQC